MKKIFVGILASLMLLTACGSEQKQPYEETIEKYISSSVTGKNIPEKYWEMTAAIVEQAMRDFDEDGADGTFVCAFSYTDPSDNILGIGNVSMTAIAGGYGKKTYSVMIVEENYD